MNRLNQCRLNIVKGFAVFCAAMLSADAYAQVSYTSDVQPIFDAGCVNRGCHPGGGAPFSLQSTVSYMNLVNVAASNPNCGATLRVTPFDADASVLYRRISGMPPCARMPLVGDTLSLADQNTIRDWINEGAMNDATDVDHDDGLIPQKLSLYQNYPNPFNPSTTIRFDLPRGTHVSLRLYDVLGNEVLTLVDGFRNAGHHHIRIDASDLSSGIYICRLTAGLSTEVRKMALVR
jgi:hypothetical protein